MSAVRRSKRCAGRLSADGSASCGRRVLRCRRCGAVGCNHPARAACSAQGFVLVDCRRCHALGEVEVVLLDAPRG